MNCKQFQDRFSGEKFIKSGSTVAKEKNKTFSIILKNKGDENFLRIQVDKGLLKEIDLETKKCDYCFIRCKTNDYYFVELKGTNIEKAVEQLKTTISYFKKNYKVKGNQIYAYIASSSVPKAANLKFQKLQTEFRKRRIGL